MGKSLPLSTRTTLSVAHKCAKLKTPAEVSSVGVGTAEETRRRGHGDAYNFRLLAHSFARCHIVI